MAAESTYKANTPGGLAEYLRVLPEGGIPLPHGPSLKESMVYGTAGLTAVNLSSGRKRDE